MSLASLLLALFLILFGLNATGVIAVSSTLIGIITVIDGVLFLVEAVHPIQLRRP